MEKTSTFMPIGQTPRVMKNRIELAHGTGIETIPVVLVSPESHDQEELQRLLAPPRWAVHPVPSLARTELILRQIEPAIVVCERDLAPGSWRDLLPSLMSMSRPPYLIVTSRLADEQLWAEALNLGAYDVLAKPFNATELVRTLTSAWLDWAGRRVSLANLAGECGKLSGGALGPF